MFLLMFLMSTVDGIGRVMLWSTIVSVVFFVLSFIFSRFVGVEVLYEMSRIMGLVGLTSFVLAIFMAVLYIVGYVISLIMGFLRDCVKTCRC